MPMPVFWSGVMFGAYEIPHGPANTVKVPAIEAVQGPVGLGGGGILSPSGCPDSILAMSGSGPFGPIFQGV